LTADLGKAVDRQSLLAAEFAIHEGSSVLVQGGELMYAPTVPNNPLGFQVIVEAARKCLRDSRYGAFGWISCECDDSVLLLRGHLSSFHLKQHAQEAVAGVEGVTQVVNEIEVD
jgi:hypothetical protein